MPAIAAHARDACLARLRDVGYVRLPLGLDMSEAGSLRQVCRALIDAAPAGQKRAGDYLRVAEGEPVARVEYLFDKHPAFLALAAYPAILEFAAIALGDDPIVTWEDLFVKQFGSTLEVPFHQDSLYQSRRSPVYRFGVYLDDSSPSPVRVLPGSHTLGALHATHIQDIVRERSDALESLSMRAGDILVHDTMLIHASAAHPDAPPRRVVYLEYRTAAQLLHDSPWDAQWTARRSPLLEAGRALRAHYARSGDIGGAWESVPERIRARVRDSLRVDHDERAHPDFHLSAVAHGASEARHSA